MSNRARVTVVVSQGQSHHPEKRKLEEEIVAGLLGDRAVGVTVIPHLYDLTADGTGMLSLQQETGDLIVCSWLFPRAAHWTLDRNGVHGQFGKSLLDAWDEDEEEADAGDEKPRVLETRQLPRRRIYHLDLRAGHPTGDYLDEIRRIAAETSTPVVTLTGLAPTNAPADEESLVRPGGPLQLGEPVEPASGPRHIDEPAARRWYPVIDYSRCTNCMECIDFCLFGVYGVDGQETILVEDPDNCRKGCPACSRVCPENAILFPQHKTPTIAGSPEVAGALKVDLSRLFGAPEPGAPGTEDAAAMAARERDEQLQLAGRAPVGEKTSERSTPKPAPQDELDELIDALDELDL